MSEPTLGANPRIHLAVGIVYKGIEAADGPIRRSRKLHRTLEGGRWH